MDLTDEQWELVEPVFRHKRRRQGQAGRPPREPRGMVDAIMWILRTGAPWADLPSRYPPYQTCHRWFQTWSTAGKMKKLLTMLTGEIRQRRVVDHGEGYIDGSYVPAKKGGDCVGRCRAGNATKLMVLADSAGLPIAVTVADGSRHDVALVDKTLDEAVTSELPARLIGDKAFDSANLADRLRDERNIELIANQLQRAASSTALNIAEGAGEFSAAEKARFYRIAKRSATECAAILDVAQRRSCIANEHFTKGRSLLLRIVGMLVKLTRAHA